MKRSATLLSYSSRTKLGELVMPIMRREPQPAVGPMIQLLENEETSTPGLPLSNAGITLIG
jgi:hypothetical protein